MTFYMFIIVITTGKDAPAVAAAAPGSLQF